MLSILGGYVLLLREKLGFPLKYHFYHAIRVIMIGIVLLAHTPLAHAFLKAAQHVYKNTVEGLVCIDVLPDEDLDQVYERTLAATQSVDSGQGVLILADVCGATPANVGQRVNAAYPTARLLYGLNVPMLLRALNYRPMLALDQLMQKAAEGGKSCIDIYQAPSTHHTVGA